MKNVYPALAITLVVAVAIGWALSGSGSTNEENLTDRFKPPEDNSTGEGKPIYYYFYTDTCYYCGKMEENTLSNQTVIDALGANFNYIKVDGARERQMVNRYGVLGYPTNVFAYPDGTEMGRVTGAVLDPEDFLDLLDQVLEFYAENS